MHLFIFTLLTEFIRDAAICVSIAIKKLVTFRNLVLGN